MSDERPALGIDPRGILPPADAERLIDAMARILLVHARLEASRLTRERLASRQPGQVMLGPEHPDYEPR